MKSSSKISIAPFRKLAKSIQLLFDHEEKELYGKLRKVLGFSPFNLNYYNLAFVHKSASVKNKLGRLINNERLEFLGDAILDAVVSDYLYNKFPGEDEGFLTEMRSKIVNGQNLSDLAKRLGLDEFVSANVNSEKARVRILEDTFEAFVGAIYMDRGYNAVAAFIVRLIYNQDIDIDKLKQRDVNYKSQLIEWAQKNKREVVFNTDEDREHPNKFLAIAAVDTEEMGRGKGFSKKEAEQEAARIALEAIRGDEAKPDS